MNQEIRIKLSAGLIAVAAIHALLLAGVFEGVHRLPRIDAQQVSQILLPEAGNLQAPVYQSIPAKLQEPPPQINATALGEKKQQSNCVPCQPSRPVYPQPTYAPPLPAQTPQPALQNKAYQLNVFVSNDAKSKQLLNWINTHPKFQHMRGNTLIQVYAPGDALYRTRYATVVPPDQFPAIVLTDSKGGHIHAAGKNMLPDSPDELYSDCLAGARNYLEAKKSAPATPAQSPVINGAIKARGYSWDDSISPSMQLFQGPFTPGGDCNGPLCRPGDRALDLFEEASAAKNALVWFSSTEMLVLAAVAVVAYLLWKRNQE